MKFPYELMEVKEQCSVEGITYFMVQTKSSRDGWEVADIRPDIPNQRKVASLLAAAPDLLDALSEIINDGGKFVMTHETHRKARAAIARARGAE